MSDLSDSPPVSPTRSPKRRLLSKQNETFSDKDITGGVAEIQHIRSELSAQVQTLQHQQDAKMHNLEAQLNDMEKKLHPDIQKLEHAQEEAKNQLARVRDKIQKLQQEDISPLQRQYDQLSANFDRFVRMDVEAKLKPMQDDIRSSKSKLNELSTSTQSSFSRIDESIRNIYEKVDATSGNLKQQQTKVNAHIDELVPKIGALEHKVQLLQNLMEDSPQIASGSASLEAQIKKTEEIIRNLTEDIIPNKIEETSNQFDDALKQLNKYCNERIDDVNRKVEQLKKDNDEVTANRRKAEATMNHLLRSAGEAKEKLAGLQDTVTTRLHKLEAEMESALNGMNEKVKDLASEAENGNSSMQSRIDDEVSNRKKQVELSVRKLRENMKRDIAQGNKAQEIALTRINEIKDALEGDHNCAGRIKDIRLKLKSAVETIGTIHAARVEQNERGSSPLQIAARLQNIEERLLSAEARLNKLDGKTPAKRPYDGRIVVERIDPVPSTAPPAERREQKLPEVDEPPKKGDDDEEPAKKRKSRKQRNDDDEDEEEEEPPRNKPKKRATNDDDDEEEEPPKKSKPKKKAPAENEDDEDDDEEPPAKKRRPKKKARDEPDANEDDDE